MKVFLDTKVLVSAVATRGLCADVLREVLISQILVLTPVLFDELDEILQSKLGFPSKIVEEYVEVLKSESLMVKEFDRLYLIPPEGNYITLLSAAVAVDTELFVTGYKWLLDLACFDEMKIVSPREFWHRVKAQSKK